MEEFTLLSPLLLSIAGLITGAILKSALRHTRIPYTVALFAVGLLLGLLNRAEVFQMMPAVEEGLNSVININPDFILYIFLFSEKRWPTLLCLPCPVLSSGCC